MQRQPTPRPASRVLVINPEQRVLLFRAQLDDYTFWITPGGGQNPHEDPEQCAIRELWEETGIRVDIVGPCVWLRSHKFHWRESYFAQEERYYLLKLDSELPICYDNWEDSERRDLVEHRWWEIEEIQRSTEQFAPRALGSLLSALLRDGIPDEPLIIDV